MNSGCHVMVMIAISSVEGTMMLLMASGTAAYWRQALGAVGHCAGIRLLVAAGVCVSLYAGRRTEKVAAEIARRSVAALRANPESNVRGRAR